MLTLSPLIDHVAAARIRFVHPALLEAEYGDALDQAGIAPIDVEGKLTVPAAAAFGVALSVVGGR